MSKKSERLDKILHIIQTRVGLTIKELSLLLEVSDMTIRRDLQVLQQQGFIKNINGAIIYNPASIISLSTEQELSDEHSAAAKARIAAYAASLIEPNDIILLDSGVEPAILAEKIDVQMHLTAICYSRITLNNLCQKPNINIVISGGYYHPTTEIFESHESLNLIRQSRASKAFFSASGLHKSLGVTCEYSYEIPTKQAALSCSDKHYLLMDSTKFGEVNVGYFSSISQFDTVITDNGISQDWIDFFSELDTELIIV